MPLTYSRVTWQWNRQRCD